MKLFDHIKRTTANPKEQALILCAVVSLGMLAVVISIPTAPQSSSPQPELAASRLMERAINALREKYISLGLQFDDTVDPSHTSLIGPEYTDMVTTLGSADAKRSSTNPNVAGLVVRLFIEAGVKRGDTIAVGCSGSFPALAVATLLASKVLGVHSVVILSLGSSSFGADRTDWTLLDILELLKNKSLVDPSIAAVSLGGSGDVGKEFEPETRNLLTRKVESLGIPLIHEPDLKANVARRMGIYLGSSRASKLSAFVNIGGSQADLGIDPLILKLEPGVNRQMTVPEKEEWYGVVFAMAKHHIPVVHLLHIKGLLLKYGLPWDPTPLPSVITADDLPPHPPFKASLVAASTVYFVLIVMVFIWYRKEFFRTSSSRSRL